MVERKRPVLFIVDDEPQVLRALQRIFEQEGYRVYVFENALDARKAIAQKRPTLVISDNYMPKIEGPAFLREIRKKRPDVRTVLLTGGFIDDEIQSAVATREIDALIQKPWDLSQLVEQIRGLVAEPFIAGRPSAAGRGRRRPPQGNRRPGQRSRA